MSGDGMEELLVKTGEALTAVKAMLDAQGAQPGTDQRSLAIAKTQFETAFLWAASAVQGPGIFEAVP
ncbi:hypothetical protein SAMN02927924_01692 [Sphingobium faniae]|nr:hypothetical protein SAMN02927924_01692 [Sphingobium faniae]